MTTVCMRVNGQDIRAEVAPRTHLADFLREQLLLTGTHLGCEHGVCGACTLLIDDAPARSCIAFAAACDSASITTIEGLEQDPIITALRTAFSAEHALQCGYCTPGMLVTGRDIVLRLPNADAAKIRLELAGNLCRCTGYAGIVRAIQRVLRDRPATLLAAQAPLAALPATVAVVPKENQTPDRRPAETGVSSRNGARIEQKLSMPLPAETVWHVLQDPALIASCIPGASIADRQGDRIAGSMSVALGPIRGRFEGNATVAYTEDRTGEVSGEGRDVFSGTRFDGTARFAVLAVTEGACVIQLVVTFALRGPLAQFARGAVVQDVAAEMIDAFARNLQAVVHGGSGGAAARLGLLRLFWRLLCRRLGRLFGPR
jgi:carbon-monoxide dehydrogenase small subunit